MLNILKEAAVNQRHVRFSMLPWVLVRICIYVSVCCKGSNSLQTILAIGLQTVQMFPLYLQDEYQYIYAPCFNGALIHSLMVIIYVLIPVKRILVSKKSILVLITRVRHSQGAE